MRDILFNTKLDPKEISYTATLLLLFGIVDEVVSGLFVSCQSRNGSKRTKHRILDRCPNTCGTGLEFAEVIPVIKELFNSILLGLARIQSFCLELDKLIAHLASEQLGSLRGALDQHLFPTSPSLIDLNSGQFIFLRL